MYATVDELRSSPLFTRYAPLQKMASGKLERFLKIFRRVYERATRGGLQKKEAEERAGLIALAATLDATILPAGRQLEAKVAHYALFAPDMMHGVGAEADMKFPDLETVNDIMQGQTFMGHAHNRAHAEPLGVIHAVRAPDALPPEVRRKVDRDVVMVAQVSFFSDVPEKDRLPTISPEWQTATFASGEVLHIPTNFITTKNPANPLGLGIGRVAAAAPSENGRAYLQSRALDGLRVFMPDEENPTNGGAAAGGEQPKPPTAVDGDLQKKFAALEKQHEQLLTEHQGLVRRLASLAGADADEEVESDAAVQALTQKVASLEGTVRTLDERVKIQDADLRKKEAEAWADDVLREKEYPMDGKTTLVSAYTLDRKTAEALVAPLPKRVLKPGEGKAIVGVPALDKKEAEAQANFLKGAF